MCLAIPGEVVELKGKNATVNIMGAKKEVNVELLKGIKIGDFILIHAGCAISIVNREEAEMTMDLIKELGNMKNDIKKHI